MAERTGDIATGRGARTRSIHSSNEEGARAVAWRSGLAGRGYEGIKERQGDELKSRIRP